MNDIRHKIPITGLQRILAVLILAIFATLCLAAISTVSAQQPDIQIEELQCNQDPEVVTITNRGSVAQDLTGWTLRSDPVASEIYELSAVGTLAPAVSVSIQSGPGGLRLLRVVL